jgi:hypothetical protein
MIVDAISEFDAPRDFRQQIFTFSSPPGLCGRNGCFLPPVGNDTETDVKAVLPPIFSIRPMVAETAKVCDDPLRFCMSIACLSKFGG